MIIEASYWFGVHLICDKKNCDLIGFYGLILKLCYY